MPNKPLEKKEIHPLFRGDALDPSPPPYDFEDVVLRYFPLRASFNSLANFCDQYLNIAPDFAWFRPTGPFVLLMVVNYGRMSQQLGNLGWTSQNELLFTVPVDWYRMKNGKQVFHSMATVAPFIFVDNETSQSAGREILGWPKAPGWFTRGVDAWAKHPRNRREVLTLTTRVFDELYEGEAASARELLVIEEDPDPSLLELPPDAKNPLNPVISIPRAILEWSNLGMQTLEALLRLPLGGYTEPEDRQYLERLRVLMRSQKGLATTFHGNTVNLKQMRDASDPSLACYQAITNAVLKVTQFHEGGMLGEGALFRGDLSGGFRIKLHDYESQPVVSTLGLEVESEERNEDETSAYFLRPVMPFWQRMNMRYMHAENVCWRTSELEWRDSESETDVSTTSSAAEPNYFNTTGPAALQVATGPFQFVNTTIRVLPLLADSERLNALISRQLPEVDGAVRFEAYGRYVYMLISSYDQMYSETNDIGQWADKVVEFAVPVRWRNPDTGDLISAGMYCPYIFNNSAIGVTTGREVYGWDVAEAEIVSPRNVWLEGDGPVADLRPLLGVRTQVFPAIGVGQEMDWRTLIEVYEGNPPDAGDQTLWGNVADSWGMELKQDLLRMQSQVDSEHFLDLRTLALELLCNGEAFNQFSFKQIRDAGSPERACFQAVVRRRIAITRLHDLRELEDRTHVRLHRYPTHPIVEQLGLAVQRSYLTDNGRVDCLQPSRHFYLRADLRAELPENICKRSVEDHWARPDRSPGYFESDEPVGVGRDLTRYLDDPMADIDPNPFGDRPEDRNPLRLGHKHQKWRTAALASNDSSLWMDRARAAEVVNNDALEPQMVVHSILSNEWEHNGDPRWLQAQRQKALEETPIDQLPVFVARRDSVGAASDELFPAEETVRNVGTDDDYWSPSGAK